MSYFMYDKNNNIDFEKIEKDLGFEINSDLKEFYQKNVIPDHKFQLDANNINCIYNGINWFDGDEPIDVELLMIDKNCEDKIISNFNQEAIYGSDVNDEDIRYHLGYLVDDRGYMGLYFNNNTGEIDFCDFEYGADSWAECPRAVISASIKDFVELLNN